MPKIRLHIPLLSALLIFLPACNPLPVLNLITPESNFRNVSDIEYGSAPRQRLDVYAPLTPANGKLPVILFIYGGSWSRGTKDQYMFIAEYLVPRGYVMVIPDYRVYPDVKFPAFVEDGAAALAWTQQNIAAYGGDPDSIFLMGHSAGAHIAAMLTLDEHFLKDAGARPPQGAIGLAGPYDFLPLKNPDFKEIFGPPEQYERSQPINFVDGTEPPMLLLHGDTDYIVYVRNSINLEKKIRERGGCVKLVTYPGAGHARILVSFSQAFRRPDIVAEVERFINNPRCDQRFQTDK
ncbi:MAG TPA: alpha/beta hydrolase [Gammaproteobacteria bacterium]|nr:alpha/beta hydrolase [Gammaproteobacteria bacterium]